MFALRCLEQLLRLGHIEAKRLTYCAVGQLTCVHVETGQQMRIVGTGLLPALVRQCQHERHRRIAQRDGRRAGNRARHVGHAVMHDAVHLVDRVLMCGGLRGLETPALVDGHVHEHRTLFHGRQMRLPIARDGVGKDRAEQLVQQAGQRFGNQETLSFISASARNNGGEVIVESN